jgi:hypothetical protein
MAVKSVIQPITALNFDTVTLAATYKLVGTLSEACFYLKFLNQSTNTIVISFDGINPHDVVLANGVSEISGQTNAAYSSRIANFRKNLPIYVVSETNTVGDFFVVGYYQN